MQRSYVLDDDLDEVLGEDLAERIRCFNKVPNKRFSISKADCIIRIKKHLKNIWNIRRYFLQKFGIFEASNFSFQKY